MLNKVALFPVLQDDMGLIQYCSSACVVIFSDCVMAPFLLLLLLVLKAANIFIHVLRLIGGIFR